jgi:hypothetical protein
MDRAICSWEPISISVDGLLLLLVGASILGFLPVLAAVLRRELSRTSPCEVLRDEGGL